MTALLSLDQASFAYQGRPVLARVSLELQQGGVTALLGPNGCGKTTLLKLLLGLLEPSGGSVRFRGRDLRGLSRRDLARELAYVPQVHREAFGYRVEDVVLMGRMAHRGLFRGYGREDRRIAREAMDRMEIGHLADRPYTEVSGGERQLALIARALTQGAEVFLMDEPTNGLDYGHQIKLLERLARLAKAGLTFLFSTHCPDHALAVADRVVLMRAGAILRAGPVAELSARDLQALYDVEVRILSLEGGRRTCVPARLPGSLGPGLEVT